MAEHTVDGRALIIGQGYLIPDYPLTARVLETGEAATVSLADADPDPEEAALLVGLGFESLLMLRLSQRGRAWALVEIYADGGRRFGAADISRAARLVAAAEEDLDSIG